MAALVFIASSLAVDCYRIGLVFLQSGGSIAKCVNFVKDLRENLLADRYLVCIDQFYDQTTVENYCKHQGIKCINCRQRDQNNKQKTYAKMLMCEGCNEVEGFVAVDRAEEAFEIISNESAAISDSQARLICENGDVFNHETPVEATLGTSFYVSGTILKNCEGFAINLTYGHLHQDIALHVNPRLPQNYIVRNTKINGRWGKEEQTSSLPFLLKRGSQFSIQILITEENYLISLNGLHFTLYGHRMPYSRVTCLQVTGDVTDVKVEQLPIREYPERASDIINKIPLAEVINTASLKKREELMMPYYGKLIEPFVSGSRIHIFARVKVLPHSFYVNLQQGAMIWPHPTIPFHLNPRFTTIGGKHVIVKNSWLDGKWEREERSEIHTDFMPSRSFHMIIECSDNEYHVYVNDKLIAEYKKRIKADIIDTVYIHGDIKLKNVSQEPAKTT